MPAPDLTQLTAARGPYLSATLDVTSIDPASSDDVDARWEQLARTLSESGAPPETVAEVGERAVAPTGMGGELTRVVVAGADGIVLEQVLPGRPAREECSYGPVPQVMQLLRSWSRFVPYAVVELDRAGADIDVVTSPDGPVRHQEVDGGHELLHKVPGGGFSQRRYMSRVEDSWERNADAVATELDAVVRRHRPEVVAVAGDERAWGELRKRVGAEAVERLVRLNSGGRAAGTSQEAEHEALSTVLSERLAARRRAVLDELAEQLNRQQRAVEGLEATVEALRRGQVQQLVLRDDPSSTLTLWAGTEPLALGVQEADSREAGQEQPVRTRADAALAWAVVGSGAELVLTDEDDLGVRDDVAALLRWSDDATPHDRAPSMPGDGESPGQTANEE